MNIEEYRREYYKKNRERILGQHKKYYEENCEKAIKQKKIYSQYNKESISENKKRYYKINREKILEYKKEWYKDNHEKIREYNENNKKNFAERKKRWYINNLEKIRRHKRIYMKSSKGKAAIQRGHVKRRLKGDNMINTLISREWENILKIFNNCCAYCGCKFTKDNKPARDHIIPITKGGHNTKENVVPACQSCNSKKYNKILIGGIYGY